MQTSSLAIHDVKVILPQRHSDGRGFVSETYSAKALAEAGISAPFVQDNHSMSHEAGTIRGLHFQGPPAGQGKLIRVVRGAIFDVAVDIRRASPTYGQHVSRTLSAENWEQLWLPEGFAHGFAVLEPNTEVIYKMTAMYAPEFDFGLRWSDPDLGIAWPVSEAHAILSDKDRRLPLLRDFKSPY